MKCAIEHCISAALPDYDTCFVHTRVVVPRTVTCPGCEHKCDSTEAMAQYIELHKLCPVCRANDLSLKLEEVRTAVREYLEAMYSKEGAHPDQQKRVHKLCGVRIDR